MYVVTVKFEINPEFITSFMPAMHKQASDSLALEPACSQFDVCISETQNNLVFLYEIYQSKADFEYHLTTEHFKTFSQTVGSWVMNKTVECYFLSPAN